jgi:transglutaminase-like putative cysteine protease
MWLRAGCNITFDVDIPTPFILMLRPRSGLQQWVARDSYILKPSVPVIEFTDNYGNLCQRLCAPVGEFSIVTSADILTTENIDIDFGASFEEVQHLPDSVLTYLLPSRYCQSDQFVELAQEIVADVPLGYAQVVAIVAWVQKNIQFNSDSPHFQISAIEVNQQKEGVCRDLAHLCIALCRSLCIPARIVAGYLYELEPMDFHAWFEAYVGGRWYTFDPTQAQPRGGRVALAYGRDATDVAIFNQFGPLLSPQNMSVSVKLLPINQ